MSRQLVVAIVFVALTTVACGSGDRRALAHAPRRATTPPANIDDATVDHAADVERAVTVSWSTEAEGAPVAVAADRRGEVVIIDHEQVAALDPTGNVLWVTDFDRVGTAVPVLMGDRVIVPFSRANGSGGCAGLDRGTGELRWRYEAITSPGVAVAPAGTRVLCLMQNGQTAGITPTWGSPQWEFTFQGDLDSSTIEVPAGTSIAVDFATGMFAFVARIGAEWHLSTRYAANGHTRFDLGLNLGSSGTPSAPALMGEGFFGVASGAGDVCFVSVAIAKSERVRIPVGEGFDPATAPLRVGNLVIVAGRAGDVTAIDIDEARPIWTHHGAGAVRGAHLIVLGRALMLQTWSGELLAFRLTDGASVPIPSDPGRAVSMLFSGGRGAAIAVGEDGDVGWIERWDAKPGS